MLTEKPLEVVDFAELLPLLDGPATPPTPAVGPIAPQVLRQGFLPLHFTGKDQNFTRRIRSFGVGISRESALVKDCTEEGF